MAPIKLPRLVTAAARPGLLTAAALLLATWALARPEPAAVITQLTGHGVIFLASGAKSSALTGSVLYPQDRLQLARGSSVTLAYPDRPAVVVPGGANGNTVTFRRPVSAEAGSVMSRLWKHLLTSLLPGSRPDIHAASRALTGEATLRPRGLRPLDSRERRVPLQFEWLPVPGASHTVAVLDAKGQELWQSPAQAATPCLYPATAPALQPGMRYWWEVRAALNGRETVSPPYWFEVLTGTDADALTADLAKLDSLTGTSGSPVARHVQRATLLASYGLRADAAAEAALARGLRPQDQPLATLLDGIVASASDLSARP